MNRLLKQFGYFLFVVSTSAFQKQEIFLLLTLLKC